MTLAIWGNWALTGVFAGFAISIVIQYKTLAAAQKKKYRRWLKVSLLLVGLGTIAQQVIAYL